MTKQMRVRRAAMDLSLLVWTSASHSDQIQGRQGRHKPHPQILIVQLMLWPSNGKGPLEHLRVLCDRGKEAMSSLLVLCTTASVRFTRGGMARWRSRRSSMLSLLIDVVVLSRKPTGPYPTIPSLH